MLPGACVLVPAGLIELAQIVLIHVWGCIVVGAEIDAVVLCCELDAGTVLEGHTSYCEQAEKDFPDTQDRTRVYRIKAFPGDPECPIGSRAVESGEVPLVALRAEWATTAGTVFIPNVF